MLEKLSYKSIIIMLAVLATLILGYDLWEVCSGNADLNKHIPFLFPVVLGFFILIVRAIKKFEDANPNPRE